MTVEDYHTFDVATFAELPEPPNYFKKEVKQSSEMSYDELRRYINDLKQSGFDVVRLRVQLQKKFAFPLMTFVMAVLARSFRVARRPPWRARRCSHGRGHRWSSIGWAWASLKRWGMPINCPRRSQRGRPTCSSASAGGYLLLKVPT